MKKRSFPARFAHFKKHALRALTFWKEQRPALRNFSHRTGNQAKGASFTTYSQQFTIFPRYPQKEGDFCPDPSDFYPPIRPDLSGWFWFVSPDHQPSRQGRDDHVRPQGIFSGQVRDPEPLAKAIRPTSARYFRSDSTNRPNSHPPRTWRSHRSRSDPIDSPEVAPRINYFFRKRFEHRSEDATRA